MGIRPRAGFDVHKINATENAINQLQESGILRSLHGHTCMSTTLTPVLTNVINHLTPRDGSVPSIHLNIPLSSRRRWVNPALVEISTDLPSPFSVNLKLPAFHKPSSPSSPHQTYPSSSHGFGLCWPVSSVLSQRSRGISAGRRR